MFRITLSILTVTLDFIILLVLGVISFLMFEPLLTEYYMRLKNKDTKTDDFGFIFPLTSLLWYTED